MTDSSLTEIVDHQSFRILKDRGYRLLARREYSRQELRQKLARHDTSEQLEAVLAQLASEGALSDRRFAEQLVRTRVGAGKGPRLIEQELQRHRLDDELIATVLAPYEDQWITLANSVRRKKFGDEPAPDFGAWTRQARFLTQRGFTPDQIGSFNRG